MISPSQRMASVQQPIIPVIGDLILANPGTISLGQGIVHYPPPPDVEGYIRRFWDDPTAHHYGPVEGLEPLRFAIAEKLTRENKVSLEGREAVVTAGSNMGFLNMLLAITDPGAEVILPEPFYFNQEMAVRIADCVPVTVPTDTEGHLKIEAIEGAMSQKTRAVVTVSPNNPTGIVYPEAALRAVNALCKDRGVYHISDEAYEYFLYDDAVHFSPASIDDSQSHTICLYSLSKAYGFASWRIGYAVIPEALFGALRKVQDTNVICATAISQYAALGALQAGADYCRPYVEDMAIVRRQGTQALNALADTVHLLPNSGAFYLFAEVPGYDGDGLELAQTLIERFGVAVIPGSAFGVTDRCAFRASFGALQSDSAIAGLDRLVTGLRTLI
ncbi:MAG TPA: pyridoxal phosphate-dependent aminotransferase [Gammaproteobacteria bacterium]|nr:pyridoxal phosphate-dependent aminotransferase [Arenicellales bacterium]MDP6551214.1 pyridoxal phosphate-dependent aminotransferase [Arenicellales bacterium]MDP6790844.1 pyridoxal phosphate-dependent aminotransferase [Arenicellales bacterium]MDP6918755.1 pyridoxal phosphate-dependent aminotransferase [Arenicellales bacterium]HCX87217.1 pyridoxal phosphate-dependent aminotransferase [Gammaproteobacteria bacterium]